jgi:arabinofuranosyltransferase
MRNALLTYLVAAALLCCGWRLFWFLTDDAFIAFRYVHNAVVGRGLVYNPSPFLPVEGYTSFLWVLMLTAIERGFGVPAPDAANWLGLGFGLVSLALIVIVLFRCTLPERWYGGRTLLSVLVLGGMLSNRTYLAWQSSGLETPLFNALLTAWLALLVLPFKADERRRLFGVSAVAALLALTRPDGTLFALASLWLVVVRVRRQLRWSLLVSLAPLALWPLHVGWRLRFYGQWWPNTYYAKYSGAWPESGMRYLASFVVEYGLFVPLGLGAWVLLRNVGVARRALRQATPQASLVSLSWTLSSPVFVAWAAVVLHLASITFVIGGDHFEYRPYSYVIPWLWLGCARLAARAFERPGHALAFLGVTWLASLPIPWMHWQQTHDLYRRDQTRFLHVRVAPFLPPPLRYLATAWDAWQGWLIGHYVCMRHQEHKAFLIHQLEFWTPRERGKQLPWADHDVLFATAVGIPGWVFPNVAVLDVLGLNDFVVAHSRGDEPSFKRMAHDRWPPNGYLRCFRPNVDGFRASFRVVPRALSDAEIQACEQRFREKVQLAGDGSWSAHN